VFAAVFVVVPLQVVQLFLMEKKHKKKSVSFVFFFYIFQLFTFFLKTKKYSHNIKTDKNGNLKLS
jgi:hypothetical protein